MKIKLSFVNLELTVSFQFFSIFAFVGSIVLLFWYFCVFPEPDVPTQYDLLKFVYFRSSKCESIFKWTFIENGFDTSLVNNIEIVTSAESSASRQTFAITVSYLVINFTIIVTAFLAICERKRKRFRAVNNGDKSFTDGVNRWNGRQNFNYYALCFPWIIMNFVGIVLDCAATTYYFIHYWELIKDIAFIADLMEVKNREIFKALLSNRIVQMKVFSVSTTSVLKMFCVTSKVFLPLLILLLTGLMSIKSMWEVVKENKRLQILYRRNPYLDRQ